MLLWRYEARLSITSDKHIVRDISSQLEWSNTMISYKHHMTSVTFRMKQHDAIIRASCDMCAFPCVQISRRECLLYVDVSKSSWGRQIHHLPVRQDRQNVRWLGQQSHAYRASALPCRRWRALSWGRQDGSLGVVHQIYLCRLASPRRSCCSLEQSFCYVSVTRWIDRSSGGEARKYHKISAETACTRHAHEIQI